MKESTFQRKLIKELKERFPGCVVLKNDASYLQGFPDLTVLYGKHWAVLESKRGPNEPHQPNQDYYVNKLNNMSFSRFIEPGNKEEVLSDLQSTFGL